MEQKSLVENILKLIKCIWKKKSRFKNGTQYCTRTPRPWGTSKVFAGLQTLWEASKCSCEGGEVPNTRRGGCSFLNFFSCQFNLVSHRSDYKSKVKSVLRHLKETNSRNRVFTCDHCDYAGNRKYNLAIHMRIHTGELSFACNICDYKARN